MLNGWSTGAIVASVPGAVIVTAFLARYAYAVARRWPVASAAYATGMVILVPNALMGRI